MITRDEAKKRMKTNWFQFYSIEESIDALMSQNQEKIDLINSCRSRCLEYNTKMKLDIDKASEKEFETMVSIFTPYQDKG